MPIALPHFASDTNLRIYNIALAVAVTERLMGPVADPDVQNSIMVAEPGPGSVDRNSPESLYASLWLWVRQFAEGEIFQKLETRTWRDMANVRIAAYPEGALGVDEGEWLDMIETILGVDRDSEVHVYTVFNPGSLRHQSPLKKVDSTPSEEPVDSSQPSQRKRKRS